MNKMTRTREEMFEQAHELKRVLRKAHEARNANEWMREMSSLAPVPMVRALTEDIELMVLAYALLTDELMQEFNIAPQRPMIIPGGE